jgi:uncharacterized protein YkwD
MKTLLLSVYALLLITLAGCQLTLVEDEAMETPRVISEFQQSLLDELNFARTNPSGYADLRLKAAKLDSTDNGSYAYLKNLTPRPSLTLNNSLNLAASSYALYLANNNLMGHNLDGTPLKRAIRFDFKGYAVGENIAASTCDDFNSTVNPQKAAISFVRIMVIDECVTDLGHRTTMFNPKYTTVGIGFSRNTESTFVNYNVQDFGGN